MLKSPVINIYYTEVKEIVNMDFSEFPICTYIRLSQISLSEIHYICNFCGTFCYQSLNFFQALHYFASEKMKKDVQGVV